MNEAKPADPPAGIECPACGCCHFRTIRTEPHPAGHVQRRRECRNCGRRMTTREKPAGN